MRDWVIPRPDLADRDWSTSLEGLPPNERNIAMADATAKMRRICRGKFNPPIPFGPRGEIHAARVNRVPVHDWSIDVFYLERDDHLVLILIDGYDCGDGLVDPPDAAWQFAAKRVAEYGF